MIYKVELQEVIEDEYGQETVNIWDMAEFKKKTDAKIYANNLALHIKDQTVNELEDAIYVMQCINEIEDKSNSIGIVISQYYSPRFNGRDNWVQKDGSCPEAIVDVFDVAMIPASKWR